MPEPDAVSFITCLAGDRRDRHATLATLGAAFRPGDELLVVDAGYGPSLRAEPIPPGATVLRVVDLPTSTSYDLAAGRAANDRLVVVGTGCALPAGAFDGLRAALADGCPLVTLADRPDGSGAPGAGPGLAGRAVLGIDRRVLTAVGGFAVNEDRARKVNAGFVGTGDFFEVTVHEVRRGGWTLTQVPLPADRASGGGNGATTAESRRADSWTPREGAGALVPPSRAIPRELLAAISPAGAGAVGWLSGVLPPAQRDVIERLIRMAGGTAQPEADRSDPGAWHPLLLARMLWRRGQQPYALQLLRDANLSGYQRLEDIAEIAGMLTADGAPFVGVLDKLTHAAPQLAALVLQHPVGKAVELLAAWWQAGPGNPAVIEAVLRLAPACSLVHAVRWHQWLQGFDVRSPLLLLAAEPDRPVIERAIAARCFQLSTGKDCPPGFEELLAGQPAEMRSMAEQAANQLLDTAAAAPAGR